MLHVCYGDIFDMPIVSIYEMQRQLIRVSYRLVVGGAWLLGPFHAAAAAATPTVLSPTAGMTTFPIQGTVTQPTLFSPNALQPFAGSRRRLRLV